MSCDSIIETGVVMPVHKMILCVQAVLLSFNFCYPIFAQSAEAKTGTATISGLVTLKGGPARGVTVQLREITSGPPDSPCARTDEQGRFQFSGVAAGRYSILVVAPGYVSIGDDGVKFGRTLSVSEGEKVEGVIFELKRGGVIAGRITDSRGRPLIGESVSIFYPRVYYPDATRESKAKVIEVSEGSEATDVDITVHDPKKTYDVYGRVIDAETGQPVAGVEIAVDGVTQEGMLTGGYRGSGERSKPNGEFRLMCVMPGRYAIQVRPGPPNDSGFISEPVIFDLGEGDATGVDVKGRQGASISGVAVIEGTNDPKILSKLSQLGIHTYVSPTIPGPEPYLNQGTVKVNADGGFRIRGLQAGKGYISLSQSPNMRGLTIARVEHNGAPARDGIEVKAGEQVSGVRIVLVYGAPTIRGELKVVGGELPAGLRFRAVARGMDQSWQGELGAELDARGQFAIENAPPGEYEVRVSPSYSSNTTGLDQQTERLISSLV